MQGAFVTLEMLERWLDRMEVDWHQIDSELGPTDGGLEADIANGNAPEIAELRAVIEQAKTTPTELS